ncbi:hypothetical protein [Gemmobacter sp.]|uniref:hypothetical protein n=1 Tax=Gemmobacter sp. TaxID=1898957 RepID=UPI002B002A85|nr:hypothetical protein [Gemmobacter sp.]
MGRRVIGETIGKIQERTGGCAGNRMDRQRRDPMRHGSAKRRAAENDQAPFNCTRMNCAGPQANFHLELKPHCCPNFFKLLLKNEFYIHLIGEENSTLPDFDDLQDLTP